MGRSSTCQSTITRLKKRKSKAFHVLYQSPSRFSIFTLDRSQRGGEDVYVTFELVWVIKRSILSFPVYTSNSWHYSCPRSVYSILALSLRRAGRREPWERGWFTLITVFWVSNSSFLAVALAPPASVPPTPPFSRCTTQLDWGQVSGFTFQDSRVN